MKEIIRVGQGFDVHQLLEGRELWLGGVKIDFAKGLLGHSDADVLTHAACDALLGAAALGDIGQHFPDTDRQYKGASGQLIATSTLKIIVKENYRLVNLDCTVICERPKIAPYVEKIKENYASWFEVSPEAISIKGTSTEKLGFSGRGEGIAAMAIALIKKS